MEFLTILGKFLLKIGPSEIISSSTTILPFSGEFSHCCPSPIGYATETSIDLYEQLLLNQNQNVYSTHTWKYLPQ